MKVKAAALTLLLSQNIVAEKLDVGKVELGITNVKGKGDFDHNATATNAEFNLKMTDKLYFIYEFVSKDFGYPIDSYDINKFSSWSTGLGYHNEISRQNHIIIQMQYWYGVYKAENYEFGNNGHVADIGINRYLDENASAYFGVRSNKANIGSVETIHASFEYFIKPKISIEAFFDVGKNKEGLGLSVTYYFDADRTYEKYPEY